MVYERKPPRRPRRREKAINASIHNGFFPASFISARRNLPRRRSENKHEVRASEGEGAIFAMINGKSCGRSSSFCISFSFESFAFVCTVCPRCLRCICKDDFGFGSTLPQERKSHEIGRLQRKYRREKFMGRARTKWGNYLIFCFSLVFTRKSWAFFEIGFSAFSCKCYCPFFHLPRLFENRNG